MRGEEAAEVFYFPGRFTRVGALPPTALRLLQDEGSVQLLDGEAHRHRKAMFLALSEPEPIRRLLAATAEEWCRRLDAWESQSAVVLIEEVSAVFCRAVCRWAGIPLDERQALQRTREFMAMIDGAGSFGPRNWRGLVLRARTEHWARGVIEGIRHGLLDPPAESPSRLIALHRDPAGDLLAPAVAGVELLNVLRATVAVARFVVFAAQALHRNPEIAERIRSGDEEYLEAFVQEVRRHSPFFPLIGGRVRIPFTWRGHPFAQDDWVLFDLYGTNHHAAIWPEPDSFRPQRFMGYRPSAFAFVPQGGGDVASGHRCPGEAITVALMRLAVSQLTRGMTHRVPEQDLGVSLARMPALPASGFVITEVRRS
jgi:fatty-acid peroxygenase